MRRHPWLTAIILIAILGTGFFFWIEWRAEFRWERYVESAKRRGVKLTAAEFVRSKIPDEKNFAALPIFQSPATLNSSPFSLPDTPYPKATRGKKPPPYVSLHNVDFGDPIKGEKMDWAKWQQYFLQNSFITETSDEPARDVVQALKHYAPEFQQWSEWRTRDQCRFDLDLEKGVEMPSPPFYVFPHATRLFSLRLRAHVELNDSAAAYFDFRECFQGYIALKNEPTLICGLERQAVLNTLLPALGEGLKAHAWKDAELRQIESELSGVNIWDDCRLALSSERAMQNLLFEHLANSSWRERKKTLEELLGKFVDPTPFLFVPRSVLRDNQLRLNQYMDELLARLGADGSYSPNLATPSSPAGIPFGSSRFYYAPFVIVAPVYAQIEKRYIAEKILLDEARLACALERFHLAHGHYPDALSELVPDFIADPLTDVYAHGPYHYVHTANDTFRLYSVEENGLDDGGVIIPGVKESKQPDAIWLYAPPATP